MWNSQVFLRYFLAGGSSLVISDCNEDTGHLLEEGDGIPGQSVLPALLVLLNLKSSLGLYKE